MRRTSTALWYGLGAALSFVFIAAVAVAAGSSEKASPAGPPRDTAPASGAPSSGAAGGTGAEAGTKSGWFGTDLPLVVPPFVDAFPGIDLKGLTATERERFLHRANTEPCTCGQPGCARHTLAFCQKVDPGCPRARGSLRKIVAEIIAARPKPASETPATSPSR